MGRKRTKNNWLPPCTYIEDGAVYYRKGKGKRKRLCSVEEPKVKVWIAYEKLTETTDHSFKQLALEYFQSEKFQRLAPRTRRDYQNHYARVCEYETVYGNFAEIDRNLITPGMMTTYLDKRRAKTQGNRELAFVSAVFAWGFARDKCKINPCLGVQRNPEKPRERYVTDQEYNAVYQAAKPWYIQPMMEFAYLCRMRETEILNMTKADILEKGIDTRRVKGSNDTITLWSDRLRYAVDRCIKRSSQVDSVYLFHNGKGGRITQSAFQSAWQRLIKSCPVDPFTFHDLKAKGMTDSGNKKAGGHKTEQAANVYMRGKDEVDATR